LLGFITKEARKYYHSFVDARTWVKPIGNGLQIVEKYGEMRHKSMEMVALGGVLPAVKTPFVVGCSFKFLSEE
jgi:hypothetical protein